MRYLIQEVIDSASSKDDMIDFLKYLKNESMLSLITRCVESQFYLLDDDEFHEQNMKVIQKLMLEL